MAEALKIPKGKLTDEEYKEWKKYFFNYLRSLPEDQLSPIAKRWLERDGKESEWIVCDPSILVGG